MGHPDPKNENTGASFENDVESIFDLDPADDDEEENESEENE